MSRLWDRIVRRREFVFGAATVWILLALVDVPYLGKVITLVVAALTLFTMWMFATLCWSRLLDGEWPFTEIDLPGHTHTFSGSVTHKCWDCGRQAIVCPLCYRCSLCVAGLKPDDVYGGPP